VKIIKNTTGSDVPIADTGVTIPASSQYTIQPQDYMLWAASVDVIALVSAGTLVVNDGAVNLNITDGTNFLEHPDYAENIRIDAAAGRNSSVGITVQEFIDRQNGKDISQKPTYLGNGELDFIEFFKGPTQITANRTTLAYDVNLNPTAETWLVYKSDGTTVEKTIVYTHTFISADMTKTVMVTT